MGAATEGTLRAFRRPVRQSGKRGASRQPRSFLGPGGQPASVLECGSGLQEGVKDLLAQLCGQPRARGRVELSVDNRAHDAGGALLLRNLAYPALRL